MKTAHLRQGPRRAMAQDPAPMGFAGASEQHPVGLFWYLMGGISCPSSAAAYLTGVLTAKEPVITWISW
jgi:hypothetical protein